MMIHDCIACQGGLHDQHIDEAAIERGAKAHAVYLGEDWDELDLEERESRLCAFEDGLRAALEPTDP